MTLSTSQATSQLTLTLSFSHAVGYADDVALLAPSPCALRIMLHFWENFASMHGLTFNASKTQLINFGTQQFHTCSALIYFYDNQLSFLDAVVHLGHNLSFDLSDTIDKTRELVKIYF